MNFSIRKGSLAHTFAKAPRSDPEDDFWVQLKAFTQSRQSAGGLGRSQRPKSAGSSASCTLGRRSESSSPRARSQTRLERASTSSSSLSGVRAASMPVKELVPPIIMQDILGGARDARKADDANVPVVFLEVQWGSSTYLPAHDSGRKYRSYSQELFERLAPRGVKVNDLADIQHKLERPRSARQQHGADSIFDRFSASERSPWAVPSNVSYSAALPSRIGAFEVHLVQGTWDPETCCPMTLEYGEEHAGPLAVDRYSMMCSACHARAKAQGGERAAVPEKKNFSKAQMQEQHVLLHSKLWSRRWPSIHGLVSRIGAAVVPPSPKVSQPIPGNIVVPAAPSNAYQALVAHPLVPIQEAKDPMEATNRRLKELDCPAQKGWLVQKFQGDGVLCKCGGGSHTLYTHQVVEIVKEAGYQPDAFVTWVEERQGSWAGRPVNDLLRLFFGGDAGEDKISKKKAAMGSKLAEAQRLQTSLGQEQSAVCQQYKKEYEAAFSEAEKLTVNCCESIIKAVEGAPQPASPSVADARKAAEEAVKLNASRRQVWDDWQQKVDVWSDCPDVFDLRPDLASSLHGKDANQSTARRLHGEIEALKSQISALFPERRAFEERLTAIDAEWKKMLAEYKGVCA